MPTRVKICGITRLPDALAAVHAGAHAIGFVFYRPSPRYVEPAAARAIVRGLPPFVASIGLFVDAESDFIAQVLSAVGLTGLQFHGHEPPEDCERYGLPYLKAVAMTDDVDLDVAQSRYRGAQGLLLDTYQKDRPGGTGRTFPWERVPQDLRLPVILAGGLTPANVAEAIARVRPYAVDVSGGVESAPGIKDEGLMHDFCRHARGES